MSKGQDTLLMLCLYVNPYMIKIRLLRPKITDLFAPDKLFYSRQTWQHEIYWFVDWNKGIQFKIWISQTLEL